MSSRTCFTAIALCVLLPNFQSASAYAEDARLTHERPVLLAQDAAGNQTPQPGNDPAAAEQERAKADALKQQQIEQERAQAEAQKAQQREQERAQAEAQKQQQREQERAQAEAQKAQQREQERAQAEAQKQQQREQERAQAEAQKAQQREQERAQAEAQKQQQREQERAQAEAQKAQQREQERAQAEAQKAQQREQERAQAEAQKAQQREQERAQAEAQKAQQREQERAQAEADKSKQPAANQPKIESVTPEATEPDRTKAAGDEPKRRKQDRAKADADKAPASDADRAKVESEKPKMPDAERAKVEDNTTKPRDLDRANADGDKRKSPDPDRTKADADKAVPRDTDRAKVEADKPKQPDTKRAKTDDDTSKSMDREPVNSDGDKPKRPDADRADADADKQKQPDPEQAKADAEKEKQLKAERDKANADKQKQLEASAPQADKKVVEDRRRDRKKADDEFEKAKAEALKDSATPKPDVRGQGNPPTAERIDERAEKFEQLRDRRRERLEDGGRRLVIEEPDKRKIVREKGQTFIRHDETERFRRVYGKAQTERRGSISVNVFVRDGGVKIFTDVDNRGRALRRYSRDSSGREYVYFDNRDYYRRAKRGSFLDAIVKLPPPVVRIPRDRYIVDYDDASDDDLYEALTAPPVERIDRTYSLEEVRYSRYLRDRMPRIDLDTITFDFASWDVDPDQYPRLERLARAMNGIIRKHPNETFLVEGHTDAVGSDEDNLSLSDRRAEAVAEILTTTFNVPAENLSTQGYGEQFLKIDTRRPERANRRVAIRRITPLLSRSGEFSER